MTAELARIHSDEPATDPEKAPALGMSLQVDLGMGRVATLQTFVPSDCSPRQLNEVLDKMTRAGDRQRAHYRLEELHSHLLDEERKHAQMLADEEVNTATFNIEQGKRQAEVERMEKVLANYANVAPDPRKRNPSKDPRGDSNEERVKAGVKAAKQAIVDADIAQGQARANYAASLKTHEKELDRTRREIARMKEIEAAGLQE